MISAIRQIASGNALRLVLTPPLAAAWWRVLRRSSGPISGPTDSGAVVVADESRAEQILDITGLENGTAYTYQPFYWDGAAWLTAAPVTATPTTGYEDGHTLDPQELVIERLLLGLKAERTRGTVIAEEEIQVIAGPIVAGEGIALPIVSVQLESCIPDSRGIGETVLADLQDVDGDWIEHTGWLSRYVLSVTGVTVNSDERVALRKALRRVIQANLEVFAEAGFVLPQWESRDDFHDVAENALLYFTNNTFSFLAPDFITQAVPEITDVTIHPTFTDPQPHAES